MVLTATSVRIWSDSLSVTADRAPQFLDITPTVQDYVNRSGITNGIAVVYSRHTTAAIKINEHEPELLKDMEGFLSRLSPADAAYFHNDFEVRTVTAYAWRGRFHSHEVNALHAEGFGHPVIDDDDWWGQVNRHSLGWVCARDDGALVGFVNVAWDGGVHAFVLDTLVAQANRHRGVATQLVAGAVAGARAAGCEWLHVDFEDYLQPFSFGACGFTPTDAGLIAL